MTMNKKPNDPDIWNKKPEKSIVVSSSIHIGSVKAVIADHKTHDLSTDEIVVPVQRMFPNCGKYPKGCLPKTGCKAVPNTIDSTLHIPTQTQYTLETRKHIKPPKGFEGW